MRAWIVLLLVLLFLWAVHIAATARTGLALSEGLRDRVGASAETVWTRAYAHVVAPFFHDGLFHIAYNSMLFAIFLPIALRAYGVKVLPIAYLASPIVGIAVDALLILPLAKAGWTVAIGAAPTRLVGASVIAFACMGLALVALAPRLGAWTFLAVGLVVVYELVLAGFGVTRPFVWAYHIGGLAVGLGAGGLTGRGP